VSVFNALCSDAAHVLQPGDCRAHRAGLWARSGVTYNGNDDSVYVVASNGPYDGKRHWGDSILRLPPDLHVANGKPLDAYTPDEHLYLAQNDLDLGSSGLAIAGGYGVLTAKDSVIRVVKLADLSGHHAPGWTGGEVDRAALPQGGEVLTAPAVWYDGSQQWIFFANDNGISAFQLVDGHLVEQWTSAETSRSSPVVVNGVLFGATSGRIFALDAESGDELWSDTLDGDIHWESPVVANGAVYITDFSGNVYGWSLPPEISFR